MKVRCVAEFPTEAQAQKLGAGKVYFRGRQAFYVQIGAEYVVFGLRVFAGAPWVDILSESGYLYPVPLCLFEIIDNRLSRYWTIKMYEDGDIILQPPSFFRDYYHDDLIESNKEVLQDFARVRDLLEQEARELTTPADPPMS